MDNIIRKDFISLLKSAITEEKVVLSEKFDIESMYNIAKKHSILPLIFCGASNCGITLKNTSMKKFFEEYCNMINISEKQIYELSRIYNEFERNNISYMPLKGCNMKKLYPKSELRVMGDADILIRLDQYQIIKNIMYKLDYEFEIKDDHTFAWSSANLYVELHYTLIYPYNDEYENYFGNGWKLAKINEGCRYSMTLEDEFIYMFVHFSKHYINGGIGCRHVVDLWVYLNRYELDFVYIESQLKKLSLYEFYINVKKLISVWFENGQSNNITDVMTDFIFDSGSWGNMGNYVLSRGVKAIQIEENVLRGRAKTIRNYFFPPKNSLIYSYPILKENAFMLPLVWVYRWYDILFVRHDGLSKCLEKIKIILDGNIIEYEKNLRLVGLDFNFMKENKEKLV